MLEHLEHKHSVVSDSLRPYRLEPTRFLYPWNSPGKHPGVGCHALLQGIFPTQELNPEPTSLMSPALAGEFLTTSATWEAPEHTPPVSIKFSILKGHDSLHLKTITIVTAQISKTNIIKMKKHGIFQESPKCDRHKVNTSYWKNNTDSAIK